MVNISDDDVRYYARLSGLGLEDSEIQPLARDLEKTLEYVKKLDELDTDNVTPTYQVADLENVWREDDARSGVVSREELLSLAADSQDNQIKVPKVL